MYIKCGYIINTYGLKGDLIIKNLSDFNRFEKGCKIFIKENDLYNEYIISNKQIYKNKLIIRLVGKNHINQVEKIIKKEIYAIQDKSVDLKEGEYYYNDLIGKKCYFNDLYIGSVTEILDINIYKVLRIDKYLIPFISNFVKDVNENIILTNIEGFLC